MMIYEKIQLVKPALEWKDKALEYRQEHLSLFYPWQGSACSAF